MAMVSSPWYRDGNLVIRDNYSYDAFGFALKFDSSTARTRLQYAGEWWDVGVNGYDNRARIYDPSMGRWIPKRG